MRSRILFLIAISLVVACNPYRQLSKELMLEDGVYADLQTEHGSIILSIKYKQAPLTSANFIGLAEGTIDNLLKKPGVPFYDGMNFYQVDPGFVIKTGDPLGNNKGGPGYWFRQESHPQLNHDSMGVVGMNSFGPNTNGSAFYISLDSIPFLDQQMNVFATVIHGKEILPTIKKGDKLLKVRIFRIGKEAKEFKARETFYKLK